MTLDERTYAIEAARRRASACDQCESQHRCNTPPGGASGSVEQKIPCCYCAKPRAGGDDPSRGAANDLKTVADTGKAVRLSAKAVAGVGKVPIALSADKPTAIKRPIVAPLAAANQSCVGKFVVLRTGDGVADEDCVTVKAVRGAGGVFSSSAQIAANREAGPTPNSSGGRRCFEENVGGQRGYGGPPKTAQRSNYYRELLHRKPQNPTPQTTGEVCIKSRERIQRKNYSRLGVCQCG